MSIETVIFDMDGVILDSEEVWHRVRHDFAVRHGGHWTDDDQRAVMGANSRQWATYIRDHCGIDMEPGAIYAEVLRDVHTAFQRQLPLIPGAVEAVGALAATYPLGLASSSPLELVESALELAGLRGFFRVVVSSDDVARGKPEPDVYREACRRLDCRPARTAAIEDSSNGIRAALAAGLAVVAIPNRAFPPPPDVTALAEVVLESVAELDPRIISSLALEVHDGH